MSLNTNSPNQMGQSGNNAGHDGKNAADGQEEAWTDQHQTRNTPVPRCENKAKILFSQMEFQLFHWKMCT